MKKVIEVGIGNVNFAMEDDAYFRLKDYMERFKTSLPDQVEAKEVMEDVEARIAEIFQKEMKYSNQVVNMSMIQSVIDHLGEVDNKTTANSQQPHANENHDSKNANEGYAKGEKRLHRNPNDKMISGVCSGIAAYFDIDPTLIRILFVVGFFTFSSGFWVYIVLIIVMPLARTIPDKLMMYGNAVTAENIKKYTNQHK